MSVENVKKFYQKLEEDEVFRKEIVNDDTLKDVIMDQVVAVASKHGYAFTKADYATAITDGELSDSALDNIAGGEIQEQLPWWIPDMHPLFPVKCPPGHYPVR